ncbi:cysteine dioxygenase family protein [Streptomyces durbertensis]|uniref:Cysteine dioxygenase family protein n=1 Tax=Streptomyces durbertensis TaxID=2448886 RepID=A0ABR6EE57_9ACTN|nr:cysteine dioxygenase family protein [Streptomyces durbertensis]MBB1243620.1 cysteine dioxygenase family protein [Streptomyces durbertensis]
MNSDVEIAGDLLAIQHLLPPTPEHPSTVAGFAGLAREIAADRAGWAPLVRYDPVTRWYHRLRTGPGYEVWLLSWLPGQGTGLHDHGDSSSVLTVLEGELTERSTGGERRLTPGGERLLAPGRPHEISNHTLDPAVSLHVYFPGLTRMPMHHAPAPAAAAHPAPAARPVTPSPTAD